MWASAVAISPCLPLGHWLTSALPGESCQRLVAIQTQSKVSFCMTGSRPDSGERTTWWARRGRAGNSGRGTDDSGEVPPVSLAAMAREDWAGRGKQRRIFSQQFKLQVLDSYRRDSDCRGNQRATARKYGIHRRQIQKWLQVEATLRGGSAPPPAPSSTPSPPAPLDYSSNSRDHLYSLGLKVQLVDTCCPEGMCCEKREVEERLCCEEPIVVDDVEEECLDLSKKSREEVDDPVGDEKKTLLDLDRPQETALCLVTRSPTPPGPHLWPLPPPRPPICCEACPQPYPQDIQWCHYPYYSVYHTSYVTKWLHHDAPYYKQAVKDINLYAPLYS